MIKIANKPIMQHILENAISQGFHNFYISINYLKNKIERYFGMELNLVQISPI